MLYCCPGTVQAQSVEITLSRLELPGDSLMVTVHLAEPDKPLPKPISSFEFVLTHHPQLTFLGVSSDHTLTDREGWTTAANTERGWVGGFASSLDAFGKGGALFSAFFKVSGDFSGEEVCIEDVRLNSDDPTAMVPEPCLAR